MASATNLSRTTIHQGIKEIRNPPQVTKRRNRRPGEGRKKVQEKQPELVKALKGAERIRPLSLPLRFLPSRDHNKFYQLRLAYQAIGTK